MTLLLFLPRPDAPIGLQRFLLDNVALPRPVYMTREFIFLKADMTTISGKTSRDITAKKEKFMLRFEHIDKDIVQQIVGILEDNNKVTFEVLEENLSIMSTYVWPFIGSFQYEKGGSYYAFFELELVEAT